jgi:branched-chain amino acid transport system substrate-binding protein
LNYQLNAKGEKQMRKLSKLALGTLAAGMLAAPALAEDGVTDTEILLGTHTALSGPVSAWGIGSTEGMRLRFDEANEKGINGRKIKFIVEDHQYQVPRAVQAANKLINNDKIFAMVGALGTPQNNAVLGEQLQKGVPNLMPFTAARSMAEPFHKLKFAAFSTYYDQVRSVTKHFVEKEGKKKICTMYQDTDFGHEIRDGVRDQAKALKLEVASEATYGPQDTEFVAPVTKLKSAGCDLVVLGSIIRDSIQSVGTAKKLGWTDVTFVGQAASYDPIVAAAQGGIMEGFFSATGLPFAYPDTSPEPIKAWAAKYKSRTSQDPNTAAQYGYVIGDMVVKALEGGGKDLTRAKFVAALEGIRDYKPMFPGPAVSYGPDRRQGTTASFLAKVDGGRWKIVGENLLY